MSVPAGGDHAGDLCQGGHGSGLLELCLAQGVEDLGLGADGGAHLSDIAIRHAGNGPGREGNLAQPGHLDREAQDPARQLVRVGHVSGFTHDQSSAKDRPTEPVTIAPHHQHASAGFAGKRQVAGDRGAVDGEQPAASTVMPSPKDPRCQVIESIFDGAMLLLLVSCRGTVTS